MIPGALTLVATTLLAASQASPPAPEWEDPAVFAVGTEQPHDDNPTGLYRTRFEVPNEHADLGLNPGRADWE